MIQIKKMRKTFLFLFLFFLVLFISLIYLFYQGIFSVNETKNFNSTIHVQETQVTIEVTDRRIVGINVENNSLAIGTVMIGNYVEKSATIINPFSEKINVSASLSSNIDDFITISEESFILNPGKSKKIIIKAEPLEGTKLGSYNGTMKIIMKKLS